MFPNPGISLLAYRRVMRLAPAVTLAAGLAAGLVLLAGVAGCTGDGDPPTTGAPPPLSAPTSAPTGQTSAPPATPSPTPPTPSTPSTLSASPEPARADPAEVRTRVAMDAVRHLATDIGPRPGTSPAFREAAAWVAGQLRGSGWEVDRRSFPVPAGSSVAGPTEGLPVAAGRSANVVATRGDVVPGQPWLLVGAHLDTVPTSPGAEDNASGIGVLLAVADAVAQRRTRLPVVLVAFGAEEPRGPGDDDHHYGSRAYVASLDPAARRSLRGMIALDRVGTGTATPVGSAEAGDPLRAEVLAVADRLGLATVAETGQRSSDHWSFVRAGLPGIRLGSTPYAGYHSPDDVVSVVDPGPLSRAARIVVGWLR